MARRSLTNGRSFRPVIFALTKIERPFIVTPFFLPPDYVSSKRYLVLPKGIRGVHGPSKERKGRLSRPVCRSSA
ncbi:protein of unknown function [Candidatus Methylomirabilis oxygeniifera]|uniref:Uncharacterized protein n=1 Tax=Methylomirabilis oxygeniifera TaxID=671143 RepID=D5MI46_METO1|nr:protein of unknown function [Candidatus Methylomirabilis oxyfera]